MFRPGHPRSWPARDRAASPAPAIGERLRFARATGRWSASSTPAARLRLGDLGRRRADDAGVPARRPTPRCSRLADPAASTRSSAIEADPRLTLEVKRERAFYADQSEALSSFISILGMTLSVIFSIGAMIGAMITMYARGRPRTGEIGTLRALGGSRARSWPRSSPRRCCSAALGGVVGLAAPRSCRRPHLDDELPDLLRARVLVHARHVLQCSLCGGEPRLGFRRACDGSDCPAASEKLAELVQIALAPVAPRQPTPRSKGSSILLCA